MAPNWLANYFANLYEGLNTYPGATGRSWRARLDPAPSNQGVALMRGRNFEVKRRLESLQNRGALLIILFLRD
jgi:hypothetical protein